MKSKRRKRALDQLYRDMRSIDFDRREYALFQLTAAVKSSHPIEGGLLFDSEEASLPRELRNVALTEAELRQAAAAVLELVRLRKEARASAFRVLTYMQRDYALDGTLDFLRGDGADLDTVAAHQVCQAAHCWLDEDDAAPLDDNQTAELRAWLQAWTASVDYRLGEKAKVVLRILNESYAAL